MLSDAPKWGLSLLSVQNCSPNISLTKYENDKLIYGAEKQNGPKNELIVVILVKYSHLVKIIV